MACLECRRRRIRCNAARPKCYHCERLSKKCEYALFEQRRGPKKRSIKDLEERLANVEAQLHSTPGLTSKTSTSPCSHPSSNSSIGDPNVDNAKFPWNQPEDFGFNNVSPDFPLVMDGADWPDTNNAVIIASVPSEVPLPSEVDKFPDLHEVQELNKIFFDEVYPCIPIIHPSSHDPVRTNTLESQPPLCLRYIMWAHAAVTTSKYADRAPKFYRNARMHLEHDEMQGDGLDAMTVAHVQAWALVCAYESQNMTPIRAFMSNRRAIALSHMLGLRLTDQTRPQENYLMKPPLNEIESEERRRSFWYLFWCDRWASSGSGQTTDIKEDEIATYIPASEESFHAGCREKRQTLADATSNGLLPNASPLAAAVVSGWLLERCTLHLRDAHSIKDNSDGQSFWLRHQKLDNIISRMHLKLPNHLRADTTKDPLAFFINMCFHRFTISLFQAVGTLAERCPSQFDAVTRFRSRSRRAAEDIIGIMRTMSYMDFRKMYPFTPACLHMAATVFLNNLDQGHEIGHSKDVLRYILQTIRMFSPHWKSADLFVAQILPGLREHGVEIAPADPQTGQWHRSSEELESESMRALIKSVSGEMHGNTVISAAVS